MEASIVIPVWNGASVIADCLDSVYAHAGDELLEVICVDNNSADESARLIAERYPQVQLVRQPVNLGFAGGVNAGIEEARGRLLVLLNQDCIVHPGWLTALTRALQDHPEFGIAGCTILNADGTLNHTGAVIGRPEAYGVHLEENGNGRPSRVEFVTGAAVAIRRQTWDAVGGFDEGFYPGYYEDSDYCYRARRKGIETTHVPEARVTHLFSSRELEIDPVSYIANQHRSRYRFVSKHFDSHELSDFFGAEYAALEDEENLHQALGRVIAARQTVHSLADILERRRSDLGHTVSATHRRQLQVGFTHVLSRSFGIAEKLSQVGLIKPPLEEWQSTNQQLEEALSRPVPIDLLTSQEWQQDTTGQILALQQVETNQQMLDLQQREHDLVARIHFRSPDDDRPESTLRRLFRLLILRPLSFLVGRDYLLLSELNATHVARMDLMMDVYRASLTQIIQSHNTRIEQVNGLYRQKVEQTNLLFLYYREQLERRLNLLETLAKYD
jgi:GT2 family glycosyltransferase